MYGLRRFKKRIDQYNPVGKAKENVAHHYDLSGALYDLFLDRDRQYSCAYFEGPTKPRWKMRSWPRSATSPPS